MKMSSPRFSQSQEPDYVWELATLFPVQGDWSEAAYFDLTDRTNKLVELADGRLEFLPMRTEIHQALVRFLFIALYQFVDRHQLGQVYDAGLCVRIAPGKIRQPDIVFLHRDHYHLRHNRVWEGADLVMEVVSENPQDRQRDLEMKLSDYAAGNISEYWIVDPEQRTVLVHQLGDGRYEVKRKFNVGEQASSTLLPGFTIDVTRLFAVIEDIPA